MFSLLPVTAQPGAAGLLIERKFTGPTENHEIAAKEKSHQWHFIPSHLQNHLISKMKNRNNFKRMPAE